MECQFVGKQWTTAFAADFCSNVYSSLYSPSSFAYTMRSDAEYISQLAPSSHCGASQFGDQCFCSYVEGQWSIFRPHLFIGQCRHLSHYFRCNCCWSLGWWWCLDEGYIRGPRHSFVYYRQRCLPGRKSRHRKCGAVPPTRRVMYPATLKNILHIV